MESQQLRATSFTGAGAKMVIGLSATKDTFGQDICIPQQD
jgi:hypothetical protein